MDRNQYLNDPETAMRTALKGLQAQIFTSFPAIVQSVDFSEMTLECIPAIKAIQFNFNGTSQFVTMPPLVDVPICFPSGGGFTMTFPLKANDEVLVSIANRCIDSWWQNGGVQQPAEFRMHDLSDGFAIPGPKSLPKVISDISTTDVELRNDAGDTFLSIGADGKIGFENAAGSLKDLLTLLTGELKDFFDVLATFGGGGAPVTQAMLQGPAVITSGNLATTITQIAGLLK
jgi:hypothetical protein